MSTAVPAVQALAGAASVCVPDASIRPRPIGRVGIIGAGAVGCSLAMALIDADIPVTIHDAEGAALEAATASIRARYRSAAEDGAIGEAVRDRRIGYLAGAVNLHHLKDCDLIVDTTALALPARQALFRKLDELAKPGAILATGAADGDIGDIGRATRRAQEVLGLRFLGHGDASKLFEVVLGRDTAPDVVATAIALAYDTRSATTISGRSCGPTLDQILGPRKLWSAR